MQYPRFFKIIPHNTVIYNPGFELADPCPHKDLPFLTRIIPLPRITGIIQELRLCSLQRIDELRKLRRHHPELWARLRALDDRARAQFGPGPLGQFKKDWSVERLEERFAREDAQKP